MGPCGGGGGALKELVHAREYKYGFYFYSNYIILIVIKVLNWMTPCNSAPAEG